jgi:hypothetical protein
LGRIAWTREFIHCPVRKISGEAVGGLLPAAALEVFESGLPHLRLLALRFRDDKRATTQVFGLVKLFFGQWKISLFRYAGVRIAA